MERSERLSLYEPFFNEWSVQRILKEYDDVMFVELLHNHSHESSIMKVKTIMGNQREIDYQVHSMLMNYEMVQLNYLDNTPYQLEEHYFIEDNG